MSLRQRVTLGLMRALPAGERDRLVCDFVDWLYADLPRAERQAKAQRLAPALIEWIGQSNAGLWLLLFQHLSRLLPTQKLARAEPAPPAEHQRAGPRAAVK